MSYEAKYDKLRANYEELCSLQDGRYLLNDQLRKICESLQITYNSAFPSLPTLITNEMNQIMEENRRLLEFDEELTSHTIDDAKSTYDRKVCEQTMFLEKKEAEYITHMNKLEKFIEELNYLENDMKQKNATIANLQSGIKSECILIEQQRQIFQGLASTMDSKAKQSEFVDEQNRLQNESSQMNLEIEAKRKVIVALREKNKLISEEIAALDIGYRKKLEDRDEIRCQVNYNDKLYERAETKNHKILNKINLLEQQRKDEIAQLEKEISQGLEMFDTLKKTIADIDDQIDDEIGDYDSAEQMILQNEADLQKLNDECVALEIAINDANTTKTANETKLSKFQQAEAKLLKDIQSKEMDKQKAPPQINSQSETGDSKRFVKKVTKIEARDDAGNHIFIQPTSTPRKDESSRKRRKRRSTQTNTSPVVQSADSSVSELWQTTNNDGEENEQLVQSHLNSLKLLKNWLTN